MRMWAVFSEPLPYGGALVEKVMLFRKDSGETCAFLYAKKDAQICCADEWYADLGEALSRWDGVPHSEWTLIDDPLPGCQEDAAEPVRVKGRADGKPEWGSFEILRGGVWEAYREED